MGYKYGVWLVYDPNEFQKRHTIEHIGHFTISCFMERLDAIELYNELRQNYGTNTNIMVIGKPVTFSVGFYEHDNNNLSSWGFEGSCALWTQYKEISSGHKCDFSATPHTSIEYSKNTIHANDILQYTMDDFTIKCRMHVVDITSDDPSDWNIIL